MPLALAALVGCVGTNPMYTSTATGTSTDPSTGSDATTTAGPGTVGPGTATDSTVTSDATTSVGMTTMTISTSATESTSTSTSTSGPTSSSGVVTSTSGEPVTGCDAFAQLGCEDGQKCTPIDMQENLPNELPWDDTICVEIAPNAGGVGDPCSPDWVEGYDGCDIGSYCLVDHCIPMCVGNANNPTCQPTHECGALDPVLAGFCLPVCDPWDMTCQGDETCAPVGPNNKMACIPSENGGEDGDSCVDYGGCKDGNLCVGSEDLLGCQAESCCTPLCDLDNPGECNGNDVCVPVFEGPAPPPWDKVGFCGFGG